MGNTAAWTACFRESQVQCLSSLWRTNCRGFFETQGIRRAFPEWDPRGHSDGRWQQGPFLAPGNVYQPVLLHVRWCESRVQAHVLKTHFEALVASPVPWKLRAPLQWQNQQLSWAASMAMSSESKDTLQACPHGLGVFWKWQVTDVWAAVFPTFILSGRFFPLW